MTKINRRLVLGAVLCAALLVTVVGRLAVAEDKFIIVESTTSTQNSACSSIFFRCSPKRRESRCGLWRSAPAKR